MTEQTKDTTTEKRSRMTPRKWVEGHGYGDYYPLLRAGDIAAIGDAIRYGPVADAEAALAERKARADAAVKAAENHLRICRDAEKIAAAVLEKLAALKATAEA